MKTAKHTLICVLLCSLASVAVTVSYTHGTATDRLLAQQEQLLEQLKAQERALLRLQAIQQHSLPTQSELCGADSDTVYVLAGKEVDSESFNATPRVLNLMLWEKGRLARVESMGTNKPEPRIK